MMVMVAAALDLLLHRGERLLRLVEAARRERLLKLIEVVPDLFRVAVLHVVGLCRRRSADDRDGHYDLLTNGRERLIPRPWSIARSATTATETADCRLLYLFFPFPN